MHILTSEMPNISSSCSCTMGRECCCSSQYDVLTIQTPPTSAKCSLIFKRMVPLPRLPIYSIHFLQGSGLSEAQIRHCDSFVYISQYGPGTASLNVYVAASIVLHHFALWAGYSERSRTGGKFDLGPRPLRTTKRGGSLSQSQIDRFRHQNLDFLLRERPPVWIKSSDG